jgi:hypothetical protein
VLEKLVNVSTYMLVVRLPPGFVALQQHTAPSAAAPSAAAAAGEDGVAYLPAGWCPRVRVESALSPRGGEDGRGARVVRLALDLPSAAPAADGAAGATYSLSLCLEHRVDRQKVALSVLPDHVAVRLPLYFAGEAVPDRRVLLTGQAEVAAWGRTCVSGLACRFCGQNLVRPTTPPGTDIAVNDSSAFPAYLLPSEHWLDWSDYWMCHADERNHLIPKEDWGCRRGAVLVGEPRVQLHPDDVDAHGLAVAFQRSGLVQAEGGARHALPSYAANGTLPCTILCARCRTPLGATECVLNDALEGALQRRGRSAPFAVFSVDELRTLLIASIGRSAEANAHALPASFSVESGLLVMRLYKDRLMLPALTKDESGAAWTADLHQTKREADNEVATPNLIVPRNALSVYTPCSRIGRILLTEATENQQYRFSLYVGDGGSGALSSSVLRIIVMNWNASLRSGKVYLSGRSADRAHRTTSDPFHRPNDVPCLKLMYRTDSDSVGPSGRLPIVFGESLRLLCDEYESVLHELKASKDLMPPSLCTLATDGPIAGFEIGFLPLMG